MAKITGKTIRDLKSFDRKKMEAAFNAVYGEYSYLVFYVALKIVRSNAVAEEITSETFLRLFTARQGIKKEKNIKYYLAKTAKNLALDYLADKKQEALLQEFLEPVTLPSPADDFASYIEKFKAFLTEEEIELVVLRLLYGYRFREIAEEKGVSENVISSKYKRTIDKLKKHYKEQDEL